MDPLIPAYVPLRLRSGDTWKWTRTAPAEYPPSTWTLKYEFQGPVKFTVEATTSGTGFAVTVAASTSKTYPTGLYRWFSYIEKTSDASERYQLDSGTFEVLPNLAAVQGGLDARSHAVKMVALIEAALEKFATEDGIQEIDINGRRYVKTELSKLHKELALYRQEVLDAEAQDRINNGQQGRRKILFRQVAQ